MSASRFGRVHKATALVPLAVLSAAWTVNVTGLTQTSAVASESRPPVSLPDGTSLPSAPITAPATVSPPNASKGLAGKNGSKIVASASASGIPSAALAAYQRAATVIDDADKSCHLDWPLIAAIGRVESDHGRADGNHLTSSGVATPGIFGPVLNGKGTSLIKDTDGGQYDGDTTYDRAVGPMQFIPSTWSIVGVDADGDGKRNPQDINDAALATAVYLCSGDENLSSLAGQRAAVFRYNHSQSYVATVLGVASAYRSGDYTAVPTNTVTNDFTFTPSTPAPLPSGSGARGHAPAGSKSHSHAGAAPGSAASSAPGTSTSSTSSNSKSSSKSSSGTKTGSSTPTPSPTQGSRQQLGDKVAGTGKQVEDSTQKVLASATDLSKICTDALSPDRLLLGGNFAGAVGKCVKQLTGDTVPEATSAVGNVLGSILSLLGL